MAEIDLPILLSLFRGIGLLDRAFAEEWPEACVVAGPDVLWGGDIRRFHVPAGVFNGIFGGPPCQAFSRMARLVRSRGIEPKHPDLIPEFERVVREGQPEWLLMENVAEAPEPRVPGYHVHSILLSPHWIGGQQSRIRRFTFGTRNGQALDINGSLLLLGVPQEPEYAVTCSPGFIRLNSSGKPKSLRTLERIKAARRRTLTEMCELQGLPPDFLAESPFTARAKRELVGNGVSLDIGRVIVRAIRRAINV